MEREVYVQVNPEQRLIAHGVKLAVEVLVILILQFARHSGPQRSRVVDDAVFVRIDLLAVFPFCLFAEYNRNRKETAVFVEQFLYLGLFEEVLAVVIDIHDDVGTAFSLVGFGDFV